MPGEELGSQSSLPTGSLHCPRPLLTGDTPGIAISALGGTWCLDQGWLRGQVTCLMHCGAVSPGYGARPGVCALSQDRVRRMSSAPTLLVPRDSGRPGQGQEGEARGAKKWQSRRLPAHPGEVGGDEPLCGPRLQAIGTGSTALRDFIWKNTDSEIK